MGKSVHTPEGTLSYPHLFTPQAAFEEGGKEKYGATIVFDAGTDLSALVDAVEAVGREMWGEKFEQLMEKGKLRSPFRDDGEEKGYGEGSIYINAKSDYQPGVISRWIDPKTGKAQLIESEDEMYPGCRVKLSVAPYCYDVRGNRGISFALNNVLRMGDGPRLDGRRSAGDDFAGDLVAPEEASLGSLEDDGDLSDLM
jgi:hypothetical protein